jgi:hypothetical protein
MVMDRFILQTLRPLPARFLRSWWTTEIGDTGVQGCSRSVGHNARYVRNSRLPSFSGNGEGRRQRYRQSFHPCRRSSRPKTLVLTPTSNQLSMPCVCRHRQDTTLLSSTYLSQGAVRSRTQDAWGRTAPPVNQLLQPRIVAIQGWGPCRGFPRWGTRAGGTRFGIADFPLRQKHFPGFLLDAKPLDCPL